MAIKANFGDDEWKLILGSPFMAGMAVTLAEPSGLWGIFKESLASGQALLGAKGDGKAGALAQAIVADMEGSEGRGEARETLRAELAGKSPADAKQSILAMLTRVAAIVDAKAPAEAPAFKTWLSQVAEAVANASSEGGFMGFGGTQVSAAETATLTDVAKALRAA
ncbi:MAG TPA: hypothetical protein VGN82_20550 [Bosea sp. (in: a-proteobacteria)]|jgi:hypothetical protein|uniref:hypothetical protein n=1 Tax=Bosea sp. (in: a-proteobacteria) TaxID=1871050 RepID=UPI002E1536D7|nr:hypothetical protein [Bosea sp. (in: a-proteobacteria)]